MAALQPLRDVAHLRLSLPADQGWVRAHGWLPVGYSELHLCSHSFPLAIRLQAARPALGLLLDARYLTRPPVDTKDRWLAGYMPIALRCYPFQARDIGGDPLDDLLLPSDSPHLRADGAVEIVKDGRLNPQLAAIHKLLATLSAGQKSLAAGLDQLMIADLLVPLGPPSPPGEGAVATADDPVYFTVDHQRFAALKNGALAAMARHNFRSVEVAVAAVFSQRLLRRGCLPKAADAEAPSSSSIDQQMNQIFQIDSFPLALDDGPLFWPDEPEAEIGDRRDPDVGERSSFSSALAQGVGQPVDER